jgi:hypothetical protein
MIHQFGVRLGSGQATDSLKAEVAEQALCCPNNKHTPEAVRP